MNSPFTFFVHVLFFNLGYGLTETSPVTHLDSVPGTVGSIGRLISNTEGKVVNPETNETLSRGETGEVCIRGPQNMKGYLNNEKATRDMIDEDGWLHTGLSFNFVIFKIETSKLIT